MFGFVTVREGEHLLEWTRSGARRIHTGPAMRFVGLNTTEPMQHFNAESHQYLILHFHDGRREHRRGPCNVWLDPVVHSHVEVCDALAIDANEAIVVYSENEDGVSRRVVRGPNLYMLDANEWLHQFSWHGSDNSRGRKKVPHALNFTKLRVIPDQLYFDVQDVRTTDEALLTVQLMVFFELVDIERMLDQTHDPVADFINALAADVIGFAGAGSFESFKERTEALNDLANYPQLQSRADRIGYRIAKVVYRGYQANAKLQAMHDNAIEARTALILQGETEEQAQTLEDLKLERELDRAQKKRVEAMKADEHDREIERLQHEQQLQLDRQRSEEDLRANREEQSMEEEHERILQEQRIAYWQGLKAMDTDLTQVLVAEQRSPDKLVQFSGNVPKMQFGESV